MRLYAAHTRSCIDWRVVGVLELVHQALTDPETLNELLPALEDAVLLFRLFALVG